MTRRRTRWLRALVWLLVGPVLLILWLWTAFALHYSALPYALLRNGATGLFVFGSLGALLFLPRRGRTLLILLGVFCAVALAHSVMRPENGRDWCDDVAVLPDVAIEGDRATIEGFRYFAWRGADDFDADWERRAFDLSALQAVDLLVSYWGSDAIAHTMLSFDFGGDDVLCVSVEVRRERGESFHPLPGMFKQYELVYVLGDERDLVRLRTDVRDEEVYLYRTTMSPDAGRALLERLLRHADALREQPVFYRTLLRNCTTAIVNHVNAIWPNRTPYTRKILMNGYAPEQAHENGVISSEQPFEELEAASRITGAARGHGGGPGFSRAIRSHL